MIYPRRLRFLCASRGYLLYEVDRLGRLLNEQADSWWKSYSEAARELERSQAREAQLRALLVRRCALCEADVPRFRALGSLPALHPLPDGGQRPCALTDREREILFGVDGIAA